MKYENFTQMPIWKKAFELMLKIYQIIEIEVPRVSPKMSDSDWFPTWESSPETSKVPTQAFTTLRKDLGDSIRKRKVTSIGFPEAVAMSYGVRFLD